MKQKTGNRKFKTEVRHPARAGPVSPANPLPVSHFVAPVSFFILRGTGR
jgi:hypothetical protein